MDIHLLMEIEHVNAKRLQESTFMSKWTTGYSSSHGVVLKSKRQIQNDVDDVTTFTRKNSGC
eukprot:2607751-Amphidinium_carterae.1